MSQPTLQNFESQVSSTILKRGKDYLRNGNVEYLEEVAPGNWDALVEGASGEDYAINIEIGAADKIVDFDCTCPYDQGGMCKHIVATLLKIRSRKQPKDRLQAAIEKVRELKQTFREAKKTENIAFSPTQQKPPADLREAYPTLPATERHLVRIAALAWEPITQTKLIEIFNLADLRHENVQINANIIRPILVHLQEWGFFSFKPVITGGQGYQLPNDFAQWLCDYETQTQLDDFQRLARIALRQFTDAWINPHQWQLIFRNHRIARYASNFENFRQQYFYAAQYSREHWTQEKICDFWLLENDFDRAAALLPEQFLTFLLSEKLTLQTLLLEPPSRAFHFSKEKIGQWPANETREQIARQIAQIQLLRGEFDSMRTTAALLTEPLNQATFAGVEILLRGDAPAAAELTAAVIWGWRGAKK